MTRRALITGVTGQDGILMSKLLLKQGYDVYGLIRGQNNPKADIVLREVPEVKLISGDLSDFPSLISAMEQSDPHEVYNLGALSFVGASWRQPELTSEITGLGALRVLEAVRIAGHKNTRFYQASSSEMFGKVVTPVQDEMSPLYPRSPYGVAKVYAHHMVVNYRESYDLFATSGICFNHESEFRAPEFVTRKITMAVAKIAKGLQRTVKLGNLDPRRDWGYAGDYVHAMWAMLQADEPRDYVIATGKTWSIRDLLDAAFAEVGIDDWSELVEQDPAFLRPAEVDLLCGDASKIKRELGWEPRVGFHEMIGKMVRNDLALLG